NPINALHRPKDVSFAIDQLERLNNEADTKFAGQLDLNRIGMAGHSFGAYTTNAVAGMSMVGRRGRTMTFRDKRIKAAIPLSSPVPKKRATLDQAFGSIDIPCLHFTGTLDTSPINDTTAEDRLLPFEHSKGPDKYRIVLIGGDHMVFSGTRLRHTDPEVDTSLDPLFHDLIRMSTTAFWDAYLRDDTEAEAWLKEGELKAALGEHATLDMK
ncbi:MAG: hypothetical protein MI741_05415, partial [Rhodospirillales bacterium]|nr:hypothetical protein [Rhodospirillales bacterium]